LKNDTKLSSDFSKNVKCCSLNKLICYNSSLPNFTSR